MVDLVKFWGTIKRKNVISRKVANLRKRLNEIEQEIQTAANTSIDNRFRMKKINKEKINVVFVCHRPSVWESLHTVYNAFSTDPDFDVKIVAIPNKKELPGKKLNHEIYESEGAELFWQEYGCINGYDYESKKWYDLRQLNPDYVFFQQPYNVTRCELYKSWFVSKYAKIVFVPYGFQIVGRDVFESVNPMDFMNNVSFYFTTDKYHYMDVSDWLRKNDDINTKVITTGFPRFDLFDETINRDSGIWKFKGDNRKFRILWTPRWCVNEGTCTFFEYKENILNFARKNINNIEIIFRPHPQAFQEWRTIGVMTETEEIQFRNECKECGITIDENGEYFSVITSTDCFVTDITSLMAEYLLTEKPIIYCHKKDYFTEMGEKLSKGYYYTQSWDEVEKYIKMLMTDDDPLREKRCELARNFKNKEISAADIIHDVIKSDFMK